MVALGARGLPRAVYVLQAGVLLNALGNGAANPFMLLYLSEVRGIPLGVAGLASATSAICALGATLVTGTVADRLGPRATAVGGLALSTVGFALYPEIRQGWHAIAVAVLTGAGVGAWITSQSALLAAIAPRESRTLAFAQQRVAANVGLGLGGLTGGLIVTTAEPGTFTTLFLLNALTFVAFAVVLLVGVPSARPERAGERAGGYREVLRDRVFSAFAALNFVFVAAAISLLVGLAPVFAKTEAGISEDAIGVLFLLNSLAIVLLQIPIARLQQGRRRMRSFALMGALFAASWLLVLASAWTAPLVLLVAAFLLFSLGECLYDVVQGPLTADLAPEARVGRYMAAVGFSWQLGFITGPAVGAAIMGAEPLALWPLAAGACLAGALAALALERALPAEHRLTPAPARA